MARTRCVLSVVLALSGCASGVPAAGDDDDQARDDVFSLTTAAEIGDELDSSPVHERDQPFVRLVVVYDARTSVGVEVSTTADGATWSDYARGELDAEASDEASGTWVANVDVPGDAARYWRARLLGPAPAPSYLAVAALTADDLIAEATPDDATASDASPAGDVARTDEALTSFQEYSFDAARVSRAWLWLLRACRAGGWHGHLAGSRTGLRTYAQQLSLWNAYQHGTGAPAFPPWGPSRHMLRNVSRVGGWYQAVDTDDVADLVRIARGLGVALHVPYAREPWHVEALHAFGPPRGWVDPSSASSGGPVTVAELDQRADDALQSLWLRFWSGPNGTMNAQSPDDGHLTGYWTFAQAFDATLDGVERSGGRRFSGMIGTVVSAQDARGWSRPYYDDENWMALALIRAYDLTRDSAYLDRARSLYADIVTAWDTSCCGPAHGGIWWDHAHSQKATASNAGAVITGARLYERTGDASSLAFAQGVYRFWLAHMVDPTTHAVTDHVDADGRPVHYRFTYNEGLMIGAAVELHRATGDASYLADAHAIAGYMLAHETTDGPEGTVLFDGTSAACTGDCAQFKGVAARYLAELVREDPAGSPTTYLELLATCAATLHDHARDASTGRFATDWAEPQAGAEPIDADSSAAMTLGIWARMAGPYAGVLPASGVYEAEEATLHSVGLEASHAGFDGWGYVAGWNADGQWVDFAVDVPSAGTYTLTFRYAAGAGDASRYLVVNGRGVVQDLPLAATGSWEGYRDVTARVTLAAGANTVSLIHGGAHGSHGFVNLDRLAVGP